MSFDVSGLVSKVVERALEKFAQAQTGAASDSPKDVSPESMLVDALAGQLLTFISGARNGQPGSPELSGLLGQLQQKNHRVAVALGACDCWGEIASCPQCAGRGAPGWQLPERESFEAVVRPALSRVSSYRLAAHNGSIRRL